jgi:mannonate dehydratase
MNDLKIRDVRVIVTQPTTRLIVVKIETTEPELYGLGCATFAYHPTAVAAAVNDYLRPFLRGKNPADIEDIWQSCYVSAYWRNGPVLGNALSGVDQALWDIKGKVARMPVYDLLGGKAREAAACYVVPGGRTRREVEGNIRTYMAKKFHYMKLSVARDVPATEGPAVATKKIEIDPELSSQEDDRGSIYEPRPYIRRVLDLFEHVRSTIGTNVELVYDVHERLPAIDGLGFAKDVEQYKPFFIEDLFSPEDNEYFRLVRQQTSTPMAMGELYNNPREILPMVKDRLIDFIRVHMSQIGGLTPARKLAAVCEAFGVRTAWHGPGDVSPVGHAANLHLNLNTWNFGIQEAAALMVPPNHPLREIFPGMPEVRDGYVWANDKPGFGMDLNEKVAAKFPLTDFSSATTYFGNIRRADGTIVRP